MFVRVCTVEGAGVRGSRSTTGSNNDQWASGMSQWRGGEIIDVARVDGHIHTHMHMHGGGHWLPAVSLHTPWRAETNL